MYNLETRATMSPAHLPQARQVGSCVWPCLGCPSLWCLKGCLQCNAEAPSNTDVTNASQPWVARRQVLWPCLFSLSCRSQIEFHCLTRSKAHESLDYQAPMYFWTLGVLDHLYFLSPFRIFTRRKIFTSIASFSWWFPYFGLQTRPPRVATIFLKNWHQFWGMMWFSQIFL